MRKHESVNYLKHQHYASTVEECFKNVTGGYAAGYAEQPVVT